jgi:hypothetical protein
MNLAANTEIAAQVAAAGAIPRLVQLLHPGDGPPAMMQGLAAHTLGCVAVNAADAITNAAAGAIPLLVHLLKPGSPADVQWSAAGSLADLAANSENAVTIATAGAIPPLAQMLRSDADDSAIIPEIPAAGTMAHYVESVATLLAWVKSLTTEQRRTLSPTDQQRVLELRQSLGKVHAATGDN